MRKWLYSKNGDSKICENDEEIKRHSDEGWKESPEDFKTVLKQSADEPPKQAEQPKVEENSLGEFQQKKRGRPKKGE